MTVHLELDQRGVATLTIARAERRNAFNPALRVALIARIKEIPPEVRCVVLQSQGETFCAGADIDAMRASVNYTAEQNLADARMLASMFQHLDDLPMPVVARVQGAAIGGGAGLVAVADIAVSVRQATFAFSEVRLGILPAVIAPYVVRKCGAAFATAAFTTGIRFDAERAEAVGLVQAVEDTDGELDARVDFYVDTILSSSPEAVRAAKRMIREVAVRRPRQADEVSYPAT
jgi:methylglutaconyl-CoA hydratase